MSRCRFDIVRGMVRVVQNWFTSIPESDTKLQVRMMLPVLYRMSKDGVNPAIIHSFSFWGISSSKRPVLDPILIPRCLVVDLILFVEWSEWSKIGLQAYLNPTRNYKLGWCCQFFIGWVRMELILQLFILFLSEEFRVRSGPFSIQFWYRDVSL